MLQDPLQSHTPFPDSPMAFVNLNRRPSGRLSHRLSALLLAATLAAASAGAQGTTTAGAAPSPDPRLGLKAGLMDAQEAIWNLRLLSKTPPSPKFLGGTNSDLAFTNNYAIQGSYSGYQVWDISNPSHPTLRTAYYCPASQSDVSVYRNLLFVSGEDLTARIDCGAQGVSEAVSKERLRGIRIFDITDIANPRNVGNVQTCRGSHTHTVLVDPKDTANVYIYISGSSAVRSEHELPGCVAATPDKDPNSALFRIEVIKVPLAHPEQAAIVSSPRIFNDLTAPARHGENPLDIEAAKKAAAAARATGAFTAVVRGEERVLRDNFVRPRLDSIVLARGGSGAPTAADSATLRAALPTLTAGLFGAAEPAAGGPRPGPTQCHDITVYPAIGLAGGACGGYGLLLDIRDPAHPARIGAAADSNFSFWHSATFNNDGTKILFTDEWGGGSQAKCRAIDKPEWGANALFTLANGKMQMQSYYKLPVHQTATENCVAHNGSLVPIPGRDVMVQAWYQGGISMFDWTDIAHPKEIAYFDRGPVDSTKLTLAGSWSVYWYNGVIVSSEIARGLDIFELVPSAFISQNEIDAAKTVHMSYLNTQGQPKLVWPPSFALARAYADQLGRTNGLAPARLQATRQALTSAEAAKGAARRTALNRLATQLNGQATGADAAKVRMLASAVKELATAR
ncbi:MAG: repeat-containing protein [Gemmatimonadetes bacterium]|nr:repeat-containing protein [Gemmatimonadota bacterium]